MKIFKALSLRMGCTILLIIFQILAIAAVVSATLIRFPYISYAGLAISALVFLYVLKRDEANAYKLTWIIVVLAFPVIGGLLYLTFSKSHFTRRRIIAHVEEHALIAKLLDSDGTLPFINPLQCGRTFSLMDYVRRSSSYHAYINTSSKYYPMGETMFADMLASMEAAEKFIFLEFFIIKRSKMWDMTLEVLERKAAQGVEVRLIIDDIGSQRLFTNAYIRQLRAKGIAVLRFNPLIPVLFAFMNHRDHRKILVVDGHTAFTGGLNISDEYINLTKPFGVWKDNGLRLQGDAVWSMTLMFIEMWDTFCPAEERITDHALYKGEPCENTVGNGIVLPYGDSPLTRHRLGEDIYTDILHQAENYVYIFTPYLIISEKMTHALQMAAKRGVDVRIITPGIPDKKIVNRLTRSYYKSLLDEGVRIYEYTPGFLHAKTFVCDDKLAIVGTINLDYRSLYLHFECATLLYDSVTVEEIKRDALQTLAQSKEVLATQRGKYSLNDLLDAALHLFAPLM